MKQIDVTQKRLHMLNALNKQLKFGGFWQFEGEYCLEKEWDKFIDEINTVVKAS